MKKLLRVAVLPAVCAAVAVVLPGYGASAPKFVAAPPGPADLGPATGLSTPPAGAVVFDLKYLPQTGAANDIQYHAYYGYGGSDEETKTNSFLKDLPKPAARLYNVCNFTFPDRKWGAVEYRDQQPLAFYFDLNADGKFQANERILPTRKSGMGQGVEFITPDFTQMLEGGGQTLCRVLLQVNFYGKSTTPNCMWSPAALLEGTTTLDGRPARLLLFAAGPGGKFDQYGRASYALLLGRQTKIAAGEFVSRQTLSTLIASEGRFYQLTIEGRRSNGLPARVVLARDTSPTGALALKLAGSNSVQATFTSLALNGADCETVFFRVDPSKEKVTLPVGGYVLDRGDITYGESARRDWEMSFTRGPQVTVKAGQVFEQALGRPSLRVRAIAEKDRYDVQAVESSSYKRGTRIYLEPRIMGKNGEIFTSFRQATKGKDQKADRPPKVIITGPDGKQLLSKVMEYG